MVIRDLSNDSKFELERSTRLQKEYENLASPFDRAAAFLIDVLFLFPTLNLISAVFYRESLNAYLYNYDELVLLTMVMGGLSMVMCCLLYFTLFTRLWGITPGKRLLGIRVISSSGSSNINLSQSLLRSISMFGEILLMGIPFLAMFSEKKRRPFHDRLADTYVISEKSHFVSSPNLWEMNLANTLRSIGAIGLFFLSMPILLSYLGSEKFDRSFVEGNYLCTQVSEAKRDWSLVDESRLDIAMTLYAAERIDEECLDKEADFSLWSESEKSTAYLAKAFSLSDHSKLSDEYLERVCKSNAESQSCFLSQLVKSWMSGDQKSVSEKLLTQVSLSKSYVKVWAVRHFLATGYFEFVLKTLDQLPYSSFMGDFVNSHRMKSLLRKGDSELAKASFRSAIVGMDFESRLKLSAWYCEENTRNGCYSNQSGACDVFKNHFMDQWELLESHDVSVSYARLTECSDLDSENILTLSKKIPLLDLRVYLESLADLREGSLSKGVKKLKGLVRLGLSGQRPLAYEAALKLVDLSTDEEDIREITNLLIEDKSKSSTWERLAERLFFKLYASNEVSESIRLADEIFKRRPSNVLALKSKAINAFEQQRYREVAELIERIGEPKRTGQVSAGGNRGPASNLDSKYFDRSWRRVIQFAKRRSVQ